MTRDTFTSHSESAVTVISTLSGHRSHLHNFAWAGDGATLWSAAEDGYLRNWGAVTGSQIGRSPRLPTGIRRAQAWDVALSADGLLVASTHGGGSGDNFVWIRNTSDGRTVDCRKWKAMPVSLAWKHQRCELAVGDTHGCITIIEPTGPDIDQAVFGRAESSPIMSLTWNSDDTKLAAATYDGSVLILSDGALDQPKSIEGHKQAALDVAWIAHGKFLISASADRTIRVWDPESGGCKTTLEAPTGSVSGIAVSPCGRLFATISDNHEIHFWSYPEIGLVGRYANKFDACLASKIRFSEHGYLAVPFGDNKIRVLHIDVDKLLEATTGSVRYLAAKIVLVGESGVGKTGLGWRLAKSEFREHSSTHGQQFWLVDNLRHTRGDRTECEVVLWDLAGQALYRPVHAIFLEDVDLALITIDPAKPDQALKDTDFWVNQLAGARELPPSILVGGRIDRGGLAVAREELDRYCDTRSIGGGYIGTSAKSGEGISDLIEAIKNELKWDELSSTVTTRAFKDIKEYVLEYKERVDRDQVLLTTDSLMALLEEQYPRQDFSESEVRTTLRHLETHGYVSILRTSSGRTCILLAPDLLVDLASSLVLLANKHPMEIGAISEHKLLKGEYRIEELENVSDAEQSVLLDAVTHRFISHHLCFRESFGDETVLIFPGFINQLRPMSDTTMTEDDTCYVVRGSLSNLYSSLVVLLSYMPALTRINCWHRQAQYEVGPGEICGFRQQEVRSGEQELVLYFALSTTDQVRGLFRSLFEKILYDRDVIAIRLDPVKCSCGEVVAHSAVLERVYQGKSAMFCPDCATQLTLPTLDEPTLLGSLSGRLKEEVAFAQMRSAYETCLAKVKSFRKDRSRPRCYISHDESSSRLVQKLTSDLRNAGATVLGSHLDLRSVDFIIAVCTDTYGCSQQWRDIERVVEERVQQIEAESPLLIPILKAGSPTTAVPKQLKLLPRIDFREIDRYLLGTFDLVMGVYHVPLNHAVFKRMRQGLERHWVNRIHRTTTAEDSYRQGKVFLSYAWGDLSEEVADELDSVFENQEVAVVRDKRDLRFKGLIREFMESIGQGKCVLLVISDKYLKSPNCLFELLEIARHRSFVDRVFPIVLNDAMIYSPKDRLKYVEYWEKEIRELETQYRRVAPAYLEGIHDEINLYADIRRQLPKLASTLKNMNARSLDFHRESGYVEVVEKVVERLSVMPGS